VRGLIGGEKVEPGRPKTIAPPVGMGVQAIADAQEAYAYQQEGERKKAAPALGHGRKIWVMVLAGFALS
jgi:hypothetical protein